MSHPLRAALAAFAIVALLFGADARAVVVEVNGVPCSSCTFTPNGGATDVVINNDAVSEQDIFDFLAAHFSCRSELDGGSR